jgi:hypothetical protein
VLLLAPFIGVFEVLLPEPVEASCDLILGLFPNPSCTLDVEYKFAKMVWDAEMLLMKMMSLLTGLIMGVVYVVVKR